MQEEQSKNMIDIEKIKIKQCFLFQESLYKDAGTNKKACLLYT